jgi:hypothetical protein
MNGILNAEAGMEAHFDSAGWAFSNGTFSERISSKHYWELVGLVLSGKGRCAVVGGGEVSF